MDAILTDLLKFGIGGSMTAVVVIIAWTVLKRSLDSREADLKWHRDEMLRLRQEHQESLANMQETHQASTVSMQQGFFAALQRMERAWEQMADSICQRLSSIEQRLPNGSRPETRDQK